jgi:hypothetical protein
MPTEQRRLEGEEIEALDVPVAKAGTSVGATVTRLLKTTAGEVFRDKTKVREGETLEHAKARPTLVVYFEGPGFAGNETFNYPEGPVRPKSKLWGFKARYGALPRKGMTVSVHMDESGLYKLDF